ncbi:hypothetical protein [Saccharothrix syringae]|uniref:Uncharacterized protein n=1 Tax=Saccharothrix syringae TaxID=103733 RepID=A0A5Q0GZV7_SACSY|nr:hypothetical protein [Saccharothrix syringae]QFZ19498.1 hypothetical protein EKG83_20490 [Saccharothrix syringae]
MVDRYAQEPCCREAVDRLADEFKGLVPETVVTSTVLGARQDLEGQIQPGALAEMLHRLARYRLDSLVSAGA